MEKAKNKTKNDANSQDIFSKIAKFLLPFVIAVNLWNGFTDRGGIDYFDIIIAVMEIGLWIYVMRGGSIIHFGAKEKK